MAPWLEGFSDFRTPGILGLLGSRRKHRDDEKNKAPRVKSTWIEVMLYCEVCLTKILGHSKFHFSVLDNNELGALAMCVKHEALYLVHSVC